MNSILALQKMMTSFSNELDSTQSICCAGSTNSVHDCCNGPIKPVGT
jgi:hypothetical protein